MLSAFTSSYKILIVLRFLTGLGVGGNIPNLFACISEIAPNKIRSLMITIVAWFWLFGSILVSLLAIIIIK